MTALLSCFPLQAQSSLRLSLIIFNKKTRSFWAQIEKIAVSWLYSLLVFHKSRLNQEASWSKLQLAQPSGRETFTRKVLETKHPKCYLCTDIKMSKFEWQIHNPKLCPQTYQESKSKYLDFSTESCLWLTFCSGVFECRGLLYNRVYMISEKQ